MEYDNTNSGALFKNDKKGNEKRPDYNGSLNVNGEEFWVSAWVKVGKKSGEKFMSLSIQEKDSYKPAQNDVLAVPEGDVPF